MPVRVVPVAGRIVVAMMVRAPSYAQRDGFTSRLPPAQSLAIRTALISDGLEILRQIRNVAPVVIYDPPESRPEIRRLVPPSIAVVGQVPNSPVGPLAFACHGFLAMGARGVVFLGTGTPDLPAQRIRQAVEHLTDVPGRVIVGPTGRGGCYLLGVGAARCDVLAQMRWDTTNGGATVAATAATMGVPLAALESWSDVRSVADIQRLVMRRTRAARRTRAWMRALTRRADFPVSLDAPVEFSDGRAGHRTPGS